MPCYHPLIRVVTGVTPDGKERARVLPMPSDLRPGFHQAVRFVGDSHAEPCMPYLEEAYEFQVIPCGKCLGCRMEYSRQWANRMLMEKEYHDTCYFVTVTYDDCHLRPVSFVSENTGEVVTNYTLSKRDSQLFLKRLRAQCPNDAIRFFMCGEYGDRTWRPHMHYILFGLHLPDLQSVITSDPYPHFHSDILQRAWSERIVSSDSKGSDTPLDDDSKKRKKKKSKSEKKVTYIPIGLIDIQDATWSSMSYVARYIMKKQLGPSGRDFYDRMHIQAPFVLMSRRPGIGRQWYEDHPGCFDFDFINVRTPEGGKKFRPPKYFNDLFDVDYPEESAEFKAHRQRLSEEFVKAKLERTDLSYLDYLQIEEDRLKHRTSSLLREEI